MTLLDLVLISFSTYYIFSVLAEYSMLDKFKSPCLAICLISGINAILVSSFSYLDFIYFSLAAAGVAYFFSIIKYEKKAPANVNSIVRQDKTSDETEQKKQVPNNANNSHQTRIIGEGEQKKTAFKTNYTVNNGTAEQLPVIRQTINNNHPIVTKLVTMKAPMTFNEFYKEATDSKMLLSDELVKKLTGKTNNRL